MFYLNIIILSNSLFQSTNDSLVHQETQQDLSDSVAFQIPTNNNSAVNNLRLLLSLLQCNQMLLSFVMIEFYCTTTDFHN